MQQVNQWLCKCGSVLGMIARDANGLAVLLLYRHPIDMQKEEPESVDVIGPVYGSMSVQCTCGQRKSWEVSPQVAMALIERVGEARMESLLARRRERMERAI